MFLAQLNDVEKDIFLKLSSALIRADGKLDEKEKLYVAEYCREMGIANYDLNIEVELFGLAEQICKGSSNTVKRIFLVELLALANADGEYAKSEKNLMVQISQKFGYGEKHLDECLKLLAEYNNISTKLNTFIQEEK